MKKELDKVTPEVIEAQKDAVLREIATLEVQLEFREEDQKEKEDNAKDENVKEELAKQRLQHITPMKDNIAFKKKYYEFLCKKES